MLFQQSSEFLSTRGHVSCELGYAASELLLNCPPKSVLWTQSGPNNNYGFSLPFLCSVEHCNEGVCLTTTEGSLNLDDWITTCAFQSPLNNAEKILQSSSEVGFMEESRSIFVL